MKTPRIVVMAGSSRREAYSRRVAAACAQALKAAGGEVDLIELADYPAPLYNGDLEAQGVVVEDIRVDQYTGRRFTFFADPDGLPLELYESAPAA